MAKRWLVMLLILLALSALTALCLMWVLRDNGLTGNGVFFI